MLKAPFPYFGGKSRAASIIWQALGNVPNYVEPFAGSLGVLLGRPNYDPLFHTETVNDLDCYLSNFWRSVSIDPAAVAHYADWPVNEVDLHARHRWLIDRSEFREKMIADPDYYDAKIAGWWVWGICAWIGSGWCKTPKLQCPHLGNGGQGIHRKRPHLGDGGRDESDLSEYFEALFDRLRRVRVCCGDWTRIMGETVTTKRGVTGVLLDPPYDQALRSDLYSVETNVSAAVREWAIAHGDNPLLRIALCGYSDEHSMPDSWQCATWKTVGGFDGQKRNRNNQNRLKERIWFSPHCLKITTTQQLSLMEA